MVGGVGLGVGTLVAVAGGWVCQICADESVAACLALAESAAAIESFPWGVASTA